MNRSTVASVLFWSVTAGGITAVLTGNNRSISLRIWLAVFATWFAIAVLKRLFAGTPLFPSPMVAVAGRDRASDVPERNQLRELRALRGLVLRSRSNGRAFTQQLRPRLIALADHFMLIEHGIDRHADPERADSMLGDLTWLIDDRSHGRAPTLDELERFVHILTSPAGPGKEEAA